MILNKFLSNRPYIRVKILINTNLVALRHIKREKGSLPVEKTSLTSWDSNMADVTSCEKALHF